MLAAETATAICKTEMGMLEAYPQALKGKLGV